MSNGDGGGVDGEPVVDAVDGYLRPVDREETGRRRAGGIVELVEAGRLSDIEIVATSRVPVQCSVGRRQGAIGRQLHIDHRLYRQPRPQHDGGLCCHASVRENVCRNSKNVKRRVF